jgi:hypothetical protein
VSLPPSSARPGRLVRHGIRIVVAATAAVIAALMFTAPASAAAPTGRYVARGDSYTSGPVIPTQTDLNCLRSNHDYPRLTATAIRSASLADVSCAGATTSDILNPGLGELGTSVPARSARSRRRRAWWPSASAAMTPASPDILPTTGSGRWPVVPISYGDVPYLRSVELSLNAMLASTAAAGGATYVDTYTPTVGHDVCKSSGTRWIEGLVPASPAAPFHPNALGEQAMARPGTSRRAVANLEDHWVGRPRGAVVRSRGYPKTVREQGSRSFVHDRQFAAAS